MNIEFIRKEQHWDEESTSYHFEVNEEEFAILDSGIDLDLLDENGEELVITGRYIAIFEQLADLYTQHIGD